MQADDSGVHNVAPYTVSPSPASWDLGLRQHFSADITQA